MAQPDLDFEMDSEMHPDASIDGSGSEPDNDNTPTGSKHALDTGGPSAKRQKRNSSKPVDHSAPHVPARIDNLEDLIQEAKDNRLDNEMTLEELQERLNRRVPDWADEDDNKATLDATPGLKAILQPTSINIKDAVLRLWKGCVGSFRDSPDFIFSGHISLEAPRKGTLRDLAGDIPYPSPTITCMLDLATLVNQPLWQGQITLFRAVMAFAVACRTKNLRRFPYSIDVDSSILNTMSTLCDTHPAWDALAEALSQSSYHPPLVLLLVEIVKLTQPPETSILLSETTEFGQYEVTSQDVQTVLAALNGVAFDNRRILMPTDMDSKLAMASRCKQHAPTKNDMKDLRKQSILRHMYLKQQHEGGETDIYSPDIHHELLQCQVLANRKKDGEQAGQTKQAKQQKHAVPTMRVTRQAARDEEVRKAEQAAPVEEPTPFEENATAEEHTTVEESAPAGELSVSHQIHHTS